MTPQELKSSILQLAVQGRLVEQRPEEGTAEELYRQIQEEKQRLIKEGKIKKEKHLPEIAEDEVPFDIPKTWKWVRHNCFFEVIGGSQPPKSNFIDYQADGYVRLFQIRDYGKNPVPVFVPIDKVSKFTRKGDILLARYGASLGKVFWAEDGAYNVAMARVTPLYDHDLVFRKYIYYYYLSPLYQLFIKNNTRSAQAGFNKDDLIKLLFPLPPFSEQKRIVAKIEDLLPLIDRYEQAWTKLEAFNKRFPDDMQKSVLQMAIQGKLVEQRPEEGTGEELYRQIQAEKQSLIKEGKIKKEKPLPEISEDEIPFDIPESWKWVRFSEINNYISTGPFGSMLHKSDYVSSGIPLVNPANIISEHIFPSEKMMVSQKTADRLSSYKLSIGTIVMGRRGEMGRCALVTDVEKGWLCGTGSFFMKPSSFVFGTYLIKFFSSVYAKQYLCGESVGTTMNNLNHSILKKLPVPLPPLAEQKRIVEKLDEILPLCENLK